MSVPGHRGGDEQVLYPVIAVIVLLVVGGGIWAFRAWNEPDAVPNPEATYTCTLMRAVRVGGVVEIRVTGPNGVEQFRLPYGHPVAVRALKTEPGTRFQAPLSARREVLVPP